MGAVVVFVGDAKSKCGVRGSRADEGGGKGRRSKVVVGIDVAMRGNQKWGETTKRESRRRGSIQSGICNKKMYKNDVRMWGGCVKRIEVGRR